MVVAEAVLVIADVAEVVDNTCDDEVGDVIAAANATEVDEVEVGGGDEMELITPFEDWPEIASRYQFSFGSLRHSPTVTIR